MKALLYPMKIEYQRETFRGVIDEEFATKKFDIFNFKEQLRTSAKMSQGTERLFRDFLASSLSNIGKVLDNVLKNSPFVPVTTDFKRLKISILLNAIYSLKVKNKLDSEIPTIIL